jgi:hypothetical protein
VRTSARYRQKSPDDLRWNRIRRQITRDLDTEIQNRREHLLDTLLSTAFEEYVAAVQTGEVIELEAKYATLVEAVVGDVLPAEPDLEEGREAAGA